MSTILISLVVVGGAVAVVLWITAGEMAQPATKHDDSTGRGPTAAPEEGPEHDEPAAAALPAPATTRRATRPVEGTVPLSVPSRPAETAVVAPAHPRPVRSVPGSYSFDPAPPPSWGRRVRSVLAVILVVTAVGLTLAAAIGLLAVFVSRALEGAVN